MGYLQLARMHLNQQIQYQTKNMPADVRCNVPLEPPFDELDALLVSVETVRKQPLQRKSLAVLGHPLEDLLASFQPQLVLFVLVHLQN